MIINQLPVQGNPKDNKVRFKIKIFGPLVVKDTQFKVSIRPVTSFHKGLYLYYSLAT